MDEHVNPPSEPNVAQEPPKGAFHQPRFRLGAVVALAVAAGLIAWAVLGRSDDDNNATTTPTTTTASTVASTGPVGLSARGLRTLARNVKEPIYWAGPKAGRMYELTRTRNGSVYIRYLPRDVEPGEKADLLIVATYPFSNAYNALKQVAKGQEITLPGGGIALVDQNYPKSIHLAYPGVNYQVEVYDPSPQNALAVASSGDVAPVR
jgi:hypothetical protein